MSLIIPRPYSKSVETPDYHIDIRQLYPQFAHHQTANVWIANPRFDAWRYVFTEPYVTLGKTGYLVDYGNQLGYFSSTWQGSISLSLVHQDLLTLIQQAYNRTGDNCYFTPQSLGLWDKNWQIGGTREEWVVRVKKIANL